MDTQDNRRAEIARRNQRRHLEERDRKLMMAMFGITGYSAVMNLIVGVIRLVGGSHVVDSVIGVVLGVLYAVAAHQVWFKPKPNGWLIAVPAVITILLSVVAILMGRFGFVALLLNAALLVLIPVRSRAQKASAAMHCSPLDV
ncbi:hypothetical protein [Dyella mobilis]|uniref:Uncharacterized protein n=1 Tax=Dyella mobilis TaxID=1849582 RepID=A0ABS2KF25_9GAMM|nr:hypothetical protein [Dyella mobilis]MBM7129357.1 hypothetical protein [Dyella mobilis]GLQ98651.1 hypothetical protein GCM10007863_30710 [Dyella mobilis]